MSGYTPPTPVIRGAYIQLHSGASWESKQPRLAEFDRWLEQVKAEAWDEVYFAGLVQRGFRTGRREINPYGEEKDA